MSMQKNINFFFFYIFYAGKNIRKDGINDFLLLSLLPFSPLQISTHIQVEPAKMLCLGSNPSKTAHCSYDKSLNMANRALPDLPLCALSATYHPVSHCILCFDQARRFSAPPSHVDSQFQVLTHDIPSVWNITVHFQNTKTNTHTHTHTHTHTYTAPPASSCS